MTSASEKHGLGQSLFLYAVHALPAGEIAAVEAHIATCGECRDEMATLRSVVDSFIAWRTDVLHPSTSLWGRLAHRIADETGAEPVMPLPTRGPQPEWKEVAPGLSCKLLAIDADRDRLSMLVRLTAGNEYPPHRHAGVEESYLLYGELWTDGRKLCAGDYRRAEAGSTDNQVWSETGCTCLIVTSTRDVFL